MKTLKLSVLLALLVAALSLTALADDNSGRIYGKIYTVDGDVLEGLIRWDKNEGNWVDLLDGTKEEPRNKRKSKSERKRYGDRGRKSIEIFGVSISGGSVTYSGSAQSGIRFGHIQKMEVVGDDEVLLTLKSGQEVELSQGSTDIGENIREIVIEDANEGELELIWDDIDYIELMPAGTSEESNFGQRLYGTLTTRRGDEFTGYICWDVDEIFTRDILDGETRGRSRKIKFDKIKSIARYSSNGATVTMDDGDEILLRGTNDVNDSNSGIIVGDNNLGQVIVRWDEFEKVVFTTPSSQVKYADFDGGRKLEGTVYTEDGDSYTGEIIWDNDEEFTWEILDGENHDVEFDVEFSKIKSIDKKSYRSSLVTLLDGRQFRLSGSNDVDEDNKGIWIVTSDGEEIEVDWEDFAKVEFK